MKTKSSKLFLQLKSLSKEEFKLFRKAVVSPLFNSNPSVSLLFDKVKSQYPNFDDSPKGRRILYKKMFPKESYNDGKLRRLFSFLSQVTEKFMIHQLFEKDASRRQQLLVEVYAKRNVEALFEQETERLEKAQEQIQQSDRSTAWYLNRLQFMMMQYSSEYHAKYDVKDDCLTVAIHSLDNYYALQKIRLVILQKNREKILKETADLGFLDIPLQTANPSNQLFQLYYQSYYLLTGEQEVDIEDFEHNFFELNESLPQYDRLLLFQNGLNHLIRLGNQGDNSQLGRIFNWYKWGIKIHLFLYNGKMSSTTFNNIVTNACLNYEYEWAENFMDEYAPYLHQEIREDELKACRIMLYFVQKQYQNIFKEISDYQFTTPYILKTKNILTRVYLELFLEEENYLTLLESSLQSYENMLYRNKNFSAKRIEPHLNLMKILKGLVRILQNPEKEISIQEWLTKQLDQRGRIASKRWLKKLFGLE